MVLRTTQKFVSIEIIVLRDATKIRKILNILKMSRSFIFQNKNKEKLLTN